MGLEDFNNPKSVWMAEFDDRAEDRRLSLRYRYVSSNSHYFLLEGNAKCAVGKTHHSRERNRDKSYISLNAVEEASWRNNLQDIPFTVEDDHEIIDIFGIVIDHRSDGGYQQDEDNFLVLTEEILEEIPESEKKEFRITSTGYRDPFDRHQNSWDRLFAYL